MEGARGRPGVLQCQGAAHGPGGDAWERAHLHAGHLALFCTRLCRERRATCATQVGAARRMEDGTWVVGRASSGRCQDATNGLAPRQARAPHLAKGTGSQGGATPASGKRRPSFGIIFYPACAMSERESVCIPPTAVPRWTRVSVPSRFSEDSLRSVLTFSLSLLVLSSHTHLQHLHTASRISQIPSGSLRKLPEGPRSRSPGACEGHTCRVHAWDQCGWGWAEHTCGLHGCWGQGPEQLGPSHDLNVLAGRLRRAPAEGQHTGLWRVLPRSTGG